MLKIFKNKGFTLIELIIVIAVLSVLAVGAFAVLDPLSQFKKADDAKTKSDLAQVQRALETYYEDNSSYPANNGSYQIVDKKLGAITWGSNWGSYINVMPKDSTSGHNYVYYSPNGQTYYLYANLVRGNKDPQVCNNGNACANLPGGVTCGAGIICNFGVSSPNSSP